MVLFQTGPVQEFIQARKTQDFWSGSFLLLNAKAIHAFGDSDVRESGVSATGKIQIFFSFPRSA